MSAAFIILCVAVLVAGICMGRPWGFVIGALALIALLLAVGAWKTIT